MVDADKLELGLPQSEATKRWLRLFRSIPAGKAFISNTKDMGYSHQTVRSILGEYKKKGVVPKTLRASYRKRKDGYYNIYVINDAEPTTKQKEESK
jgi:hypothetical protein